MAANVTISFFLELSGTHFAPASVNFSHEKGISQYCKVLKLHCMYLVVLNGIIWQYPSSHSIAWYCMEMDIITWNYILLKFTSHMKKAPGVSLGHLPNGASLALSL